MFIASEVLSQAVISTDNNSPGRKVSSIMRRSSNSKLDIFAYLDSKAKQESGSVATQRVLKNTKSIGDEFLNSYD